MSHAYRSKSLFISFGLLLTVGLHSVCSSAQQLEAFETQLDQTIRSACHGNMVEAIPDFMSGVRDWITESSPFCETVRTMPEEDNAYDYLKSQNPELAKPTTDAEIKTLFGYNEDLYRHADCDDWMCNHIRDRVFNDGNPISLSDYKVVEQHCDGDYSCLESWFKQWPRPLPESPSATGLSLDELMGQAKPADVPQTQNQSAQLQAQPAGMSLDQLIGNDVAIAPPPSRGSQANPVSSPSSRTLAASLSLDDVFAAREELELNQLKLTINDKHTHMANSCACSLNKSGCYQLPHESLLAPAGQREQKRFDYCSDWRTTKNTIITTTAAANDTLAALDRIQSNIAKNDADMKSTIARWQEKHQKQIAQQQQASQKRQGFAYLAAMGSIAMQAATAPNGDLSIESAARNALSLHNNLAGDSPATTPSSREVRSSLPKQPSTNPHKPELMAANNPNSSSAAADSKLNTSSANDRYAVCTIRTGLKVIAGCINVSGLDNNTPCTGENGNQICAQDMFELCQKVGKKTGALFDEYSSGMGYNASMKQCIAKCENNYGEANWGQYGRKCLGAVSTR